MSTTPQSGADVLARIRRAPVEETVEICPVSHLIDDWTAANDELTRVVAVDVSKQRLGGTATSAAQVAAAQAVADIEAAIEASVIRFTLRALTPDRWRALCDEHPPRRGNDFDMYAGYDRDAVIDHAVELCMVSPKFDTCELSGCEHTDCGTWDEFAKFCNAGEWNELRKVADRVNGQVMERPKSELASRVLSRVEPPSPPPATGQDRAPDDSTDGNLNKSSSTTAQTEVPAEPQTLIPL